jgi:ubiquinone/menaquinone biosynthesis C-methylase UbiE
MDDKKEQYIPALSYRWLTRFYDPIIGFTMRESTFKRRMVGQAKIRVNQRVLDLGCGTATLTIQIKKNNPGAEVVGLDGDTKVMGIARMKISESNLDINLRWGMAYDLPFPDSYFDHVFSSLLFHHLTNENKSRTIQEVFRVLRPGRMFYLTDFGRPGNKLMYLSSLIMRRLEETTGNFEGLLPIMLGKAGFDQISEYARYMTIFGSISLYNAHKPG